MTGKMHSVKFLTIGRIEQALLIDFACNRGNLMLAPDFFKLNCLLYQIRNY